MRMGFSTGMDMGMGMPIKEEGMFMSFFHSMPLWLQGIATAVLVIALAWIAGIIIGKLYASVKYPDPEKPSLINPLLKIGLGAAILVCGFWVYHSVTKPPEAPEMPPVDNMEMTEGEAEEALPGENSADVGIMTDSPMMAAAEEVALG